MDRLQSYSWPGNIRELQNIIERSVIVCDTEDFFVDESWLYHTPSRPLADDRYVCWAALANTRTEPHDEIDNAMDAKMWNMVRSVPAWNA